MLYMHDTKSAEFVTPSWDRKVNLTCKQKNENVNLLISDDKNEVYNF